MIDWTRATTSGKRSIGSLSKKYVEENSMELNNWLGIALKTVGDDKFVYLGHQKVSGYVMHIGKWQWLESISQQKIYDLLKSR